MLSSRFATTLLRQASVDIIGVVILATVIISILAFFSAVVLSYATKRQPLRSNARVTASVLGSVFALLIVGLLILGRLLFGPDPPSLADLQKSFPKHRSDLETLLRMSDEDPDYARIDPDFVYHFPKVDPSTGQTDYDDSRAPMPSNRWDEYRAIYRRDGITLGIDRNQAHDAFIMVASQGLLNRGHISGYVYCADPLGAQLPNIFRYEPCTSRLDAGQHRRGVGTDEGYSFKKLADRWYAYDQGPS